MFKLYNHNLYVNKKVCEIKHSKYINIIVFSFILYNSLLKTGFIYNKEGGFRPFGVGYKHKTVVPMWLIAIFLAILCYMFVLVYVLNM